MDTQVALTGILGMVSLGVFAGSIYLATHGHDGTNWAVVAVLLLLGTCSVAGV